MAGSEQPTPLGPTLGLIAVLAIGAFLLVMPVIGLVAPATPLPAPFPDQHQRAETATYLVSFGVLLPLAVVAGRRLAGRLVDGGGPAAPALAGAALAAGLGAALAAVRAVGALGGDDGIRAVLIAGLIWWLAVLVVVRRAARPLPPRIADAAPAAWGAVAGLGVVVLLCFADLGSINWIVVAAGAAVVWLAVTRRRRVRPLSPGRRTRLALDALVVALVLALVPDLVIFRPEQAASDLAVAIETGIIQFHHDFLLGPANEVLAGEPLLRGTASQYGVGSLYLLVGWFEVAPIGYGTLGFLTGAMTAGWFAAGYVVLRLAGTARLLAAAALGVAIVALAFNLTYPVGALPQSGPLRFGLPMALVLAAAVAERLPTRARAARVAELGVLGLSAVWSLEAFAFTAVTFAAISVARATLRPGPGRLRTIGAALGWGAIACITAHVALALATVAATGGPPRWGEYLAYLREFLTGPVGDLTYDVSRWTPGLAIGAGYLVSAAALIELTRRGGGLVARERPALVVLAGLTAYGIALLSYYVDRSQDHILVHVALPALLVGAGWLGVIDRTRAEADPRARTTGLAVGLGVAVLVLAVAWSSVDERFPRTPLAHAAPGAPGLRAALHRLWHPPPLNPAAPAGERALERWMPGERRSVVLTEPDLATEILVRSRRADRLLLGDPWETSFVSHRMLPGLRRRIDALRAGDRVLLDDPARQTLASLHAAPQLDPLRDPVKRLAPLQEWALHRLSTRYRLRPVAPAVDGFTAMQLEARR